MSHHYIERYYNWISLNEDVNSISIVYFKVDIPSKEADHVNSNKRLILPYCKTILTNLFSKHLPNFKIKKIDGNVGNFVIDLNNPFFPEEDIQFNINLYELFKDPSLAYRALNNKLYSNIETDRLTKITKTEDFSLFRFNKAESNELSIEGFKKFIFDKINNSTVNSPSDNTLVKDIMLETIESISSDINEYANFNNEYLSSFSHIEIPELLNKIEKSLTTYCYYEYNFQLLNVLTIEKIVNTKDSLKKEMTDLVSPIVKIDYSKSLNTNEKIKLFNIIKGATSTLINYIDRGGIEEEIAEPALFELIQKTESFLEDNNNIPSKK